MGLWSRFTNVIKSNINELINRAEDPEKMLSQAILDMREQLTDAKKEVASAIADEKRMQKQYETECAQAREWEKKARYAVQKGDDALAKEALVRKQEHERLAEQYRKQWEAQKESTHKLKEALRRLNNRIEEANRKKQLLVVRKKRAEAQKKIHETMSSLSDTSAFENFERMERKVEEIEARADAQVELTAEIGAEVLEEKFLALETDESGADVALLELKREMGMLPEKAGGDPNEGKTPPQEAKGGEEKAAEGEGAEKS